MAAFKYADMDYLKMLLNRYFKNASYLKDYLIEEQKNAEKEKGIDHETFFDECNNVIENLKKEIHNLKVQKLQQLETLLNEGYNKKDKDLIEYAEQEIEGYTQRNAEEKLFISFARSSEEEKRIFPADIRELADNIRWAKTDVYLKKIKINSSTTIEEKTLNEDSVSNHSHIFKRNGFAVFEEYHSYKNLTEQSRTDLRALFEFLKEDDLLVETVALQHYIHWLNKTYDYSLIELKKVDLKSRPNLQRKNDYQRCKEKANE